MANQNLIDQLTAAAKKFQSVDKDKIFRPNLGEESLVTDLKPKLEKLNEQLVFASVYAPEVADVHLEPLISAYQQLFTILDAQTKRSTSDYINNRNVVITGVTNQAEIILKSWPPFVTAAVEARGFLQDEGIKKSIN